MRHDGGEFILCHRILEESAVDTNDATRHGKGVDSGIVNDNEFNPSVLKLAMLYQLKHQAFQITVQQGVIFDGGLPTEASEPHPPQLIFIVSGEQAGAGFTQIRYLEALGDRHRRMRRSDDADQQKEPAWRMNQKPSEHGGTLAYLASLHESAVAVKIGSLPNPKANKRYTPAPQ